MLVLADDDNDCVGGIVGQGEVLILAPEHLLAGLLVLELELADVGAKDVVLDFFLVLVVADMLNNIRNTSR